MPAAVVAVDIGVHRVDELLWMGGDAMSDLDDIFVGSFCKCPECDSNKIWLSKDRKRIRCETCGYREVHGE